MKNFLLLLLILLVIIKPDLYSEEITGSVIFISGKEFRTKTKGSKEWITNNSDIQLKAGMRIKTDNHTSLRVMLKERFLIFIPPDSDINFTTLTERDEVITILKGKILINASTSKSKGLINTPTADIVRDKPASVLINVDPRDGTTEVIAVEQEVSVKNLIQTDNNYKILKQGTYSKILPQVLPTEPTQFREKDIEDLLKKIRTPISTASIKLQDEKIFDRFIEDFLFDPFFIGSSSKPSPCKEIYTSPAIPVDFDRNLLMRKTGLILNFK